jgi:hypothetical protein
MLLVFGMLKAEDLREIENISLVHA